MLKRVSGGLKIAFTGFNLLRLFAPVNDLLGTFAQNFNKTSPPDYLYETVVCSPALVPKLQLGNRRLPVNRPESRRRTGTLARLRSRPAGVPVLRKWLHFSPLCTFTGVGALAGSCGGEGQELLQEHCWTSRQRQPRHSPAGCRGPRHSAAHQPSINARSRATRSGSVWATLFFSYGSASTLYNSTGASGTLAASGSISFQAPWMHQR